MTGKYPSPPPRATHLYVSGFAERLNATLTLNCGDATVELPGGALRHLRAHLRPWGFEAEVRFMVSLEQEEDPVFAHLGGNALVKATVTVCSREEPADGYEAPVPLSFRGLVTERRVEERTGVALEGEPVLGRLYTVTVQDTAAVLWRQHQPCELHVATTLGSVLEGHKVGGLQLSYDWKALTDDRALVTVPCGNDAGPCNFYDFVSWLCDRYDGTLEHDYPTAAYKLVDKRSKDASPSPLLRDDVAELRLELPPPPRHAARVRNGHATSGATTPVPASAAVSGVFQEHLVRTPLTTDASARAALEARRLVPGKDRATVTFRRFPVVGLWPGKFAVADDGWTDKSRHAKKPFRVLEFHLEARPTGEEVSDNELDSPDAAFECRAHAVLELANSRRLPRLPYRAPRWPLHVEGRVVSVGGDDDDRTWLAVVDDVTSRTFQTVFVPLWNKLVPVPFEPGGATGAFFFPPYKDARVLLALEWDNARVVRHLDWAKGASTPKDGQGNRLVFGKQPSNGTYLEHAYVDGKPKLTLKRTLGKDVQTIVFSEGDILLKLEEDATATAVTPKADLSIEVEAAKGALNMEVKGGIQKVSKAFDAALGGSTAALEGATEELEAELTTAEASLRSRVDTTRAELEEALSGLGAALETVAAAVTAAKSELMAALEADALGPKISEAESAVDDLLSDARRQLSELRRLLESLADEAQEPLQQVAVRLASLEQTLKSVLAALTARLRSLLPPE